MEARFVRFSESGKTRSQTTNGAKACLPGFVVLEINRHASAPSTYLQAARSLWPILLVTTDIRNSQQSVLPAVCTSRNYPHSHSDPLPELLSPVRQDAYRSGHPPPACPRPRAVHQLPDRLRMRPGRLLRYGPSSTYIFTPRTNSPPSTAAPTVTTTSTSPTTASYPVTQSTSSVYVVTTTSTSSITTVVAPSSLTWTATYAAGNGSVGSVTATRAVMPSGIQTARAAGEVVPMGGTVAAALLAVVGGVVLRV